MKAAGQRFSALPEVYSICRLEPEAEMPGWVGGTFFSITSTAEEVSVICPASRVPRSVRAERDWRVLKLAGPYPFSAVGVLASVVAPLAEARISVLTVATFDTDYILVKDERFDEAIATLVAAGHTLVA